MWDGILLVLGEGKFWSDLTRLAIASLPCVLELQLPIVV